MIPSAVFVAAVALQSKFALTSKFSRNVASIPKLTCFVDLEDGVNVDEVKSQPFSVGAGLRKWCVLPPLLFIVYIRQWRT